MSAPAPRTDDIGLLAAKLVGAPDRAPDLTAAPPLVDALQDAGAADWAGAVQSCVAELYAEWFPKQIAADAEVPPVVPPAHLLPGLLHERLAARLGFLLYDFASLCGAMAARLGPTHAEASRAELETVRITHTAGMEVGHRVPLPDGRMGLVVAVDTRDRVAQVLPLEPQGEQGMPPMAMQRPIRSGRRFA